MTWGNTRHKYRAIQTVVDGHTFPSRAEARHYGELRLMERAGEITGLELQPSFDLTVNGVHICRYVADFAYTVTADGRRVVADVKGVRTRVYIMKRRLLLALHGIDVLEVEV